MEDKILIEFSIENGRVRYSFCHNCKVTMRVMKFVEYEYNDIKAEKDKIALKFEETLNNSFLINLTRHHLLNDKHTCEDYSATTGIGAYFIAELYCSECDKKIIYPDDKN
jgi:hypothetical protein